MISIVIPSYNRRDSTIALLHDIDAQEDEPFEVIVVDDHSSDDTVATIRELYPQVLVLENPTNVGPAVTRNRGILVASGDIVVGLDSDVTIPDSLMIHKIRAMMKSSQATGFAFRIKATDGESDDAPRWWHPYPIDTYASKTFYTPYFSGTAYAFRKEALIKSGLFPEILYMHFEEVELGWRILDQGGSILYSPDLQVVHHPHTISKRNRVEVFYKPRNQILLAVSCLPFPQVISYVAPRIAYQLFKACFRGHLTQFFESMGSAARLLPRQLSRRRPLRKTTIQHIKINNTPKSFELFCFRRNHCQD